MNNARLRSNGLLLTTALIWGSAFVAQRQGMEHMGPMLFNGIRFLIGTAALYPVYLVARRRRAAGLVADSLETSGSSGSSGSDASASPVLSGPAGVATGPLPPASGSRAQNFAGLIAGLVLFSGASLQQIGIVYTTAGNAGFITGLYIVLVPLLAGFLGHRTPAFAWAGVTVSVAGLYLLSVGENFRISPGDLLVLASAFFWALHVLVIDRAVKHQDSLLLSLQQYLVCGLLSLALGLFLELPAMDGISGIIAALPAILYGGIMSVSVAYTLQILGQRHAHPSHAALILSLEGAFAALGGYLILGELLSARQLLGALLMIAAMVLSQLDLFMKNPGKPADSAVGRAENPIQQPQRNPDPENRNG